MALDFAALAAKPIADIARLQSLTSPSNAGGVQTDSRLIAADTTPILGGP